MKLSNRRMVELWNRRMVEWWSCRIVESLNGGMVELSNRRMVAWNGGLELILSNGVRHPDPHQRCSTTGDFSSFEFECAIRIFACAMLVVIGGTISQADNVHVTTKPIKAVTSVF